MSCQSLVAYCSCCGSEMYAQLCPIPGEGRSDLIWVCTGMDRLRRRCTCVIPRADAERTDDTG